MISLLYFSPVTEEPLSSLSRDLVLYRASEAHNLAMVSHSLALGANKNWHNQDENGQTPLHRAVASVSMQTLMQIELNRVCIFYVRTCMLHLG